MERKLVYLLKFKTQIRSSSVAFTFTFYSSVCAHWKKGKNKSGRYDIMKGTSPNQKYTNQGQANLPPRNPKGPSRHYKQSLNSLFVICKQEK